MLERLKGINETQVTELMNGPIKQQLGIIPDGVKWGGQSGAVFEAKSYVTKIFLSKIFKPMKRFATQAIKVKK